MPANADTLRELYEPKQLQGIIRANALRESYDQTQTHLGNHMSQRKHT